MVVNLLQTYLFYSVKVNLIQICLIIIIIGLSILLYKSNFNNYNDRSFLMYYLIRQSFKYILFPPSFFQSLVVPSFFISLIFFCLFPSPTQPYY